MSEELDKLSVKEIKERISQMQDRLKVLEWDDKHNQINPYKKMELDNMKKEHEELQKKLDEMTLEA